MAPASKVRVYQSALLDAMLRDDDEEVPQGEAAEEAEEELPQVAPTEVAPLPEPTPLVQQPRDLPRVTTIPKQADFAASQRAARQQMYQKAQEQIQKDLERRKQEKAQKRETVFQTMFSAVMEGVDGQGGLNKEIDDMLATYDAAKLKKSKELHEEWKATVFDKIQRQVTRHVDSLDARELTDRLTGHYNEFINAVNTKQDKNDQSGIFRDTVLPYDYDPLKSKAYVYKYTMPPLNDPLKRDIQKKIKEKLVLGIAEAVSAGAARETLAVTLWDKLESTPYARFTDENGDMLPHNVSEHASKRSQSKVEYDQYNIPQGREVMMAECPKGVRIIPPAGHRAGRADLTDVVNHRVDHSKGETGGDQWLEAKGKKADIPIPGVSGERKDLFDVVNQLGDPADRSGNGDQWLSAKGKRIVPPASTVYSDRKDLFETVQQTSPVVGYYMRDRPDQTCGDQWLDAKGKRRVEGVPESGSEGGLYTVLNDEQ